MLVGRKKKGFRTKIIFEFSPDNLKEEVRALSFPTHNAHFNGELQGQEETDGAFLYFTHSQVPESSAVYL